MGHIDVVSEAEFDDPVLVEGLPGVGLVGKIVADHLVESLGMEHHANVHCDALPPAAAYAAGDRTVRTPLRLYAAPDDDLLVLQSDVPVSPDAAEELADCIDDWFRRESVTPLYIAGMGRDGDGDEEGEGEEPRTLHGIAVGGGAALLDGVDVPEPESAGLVSGPTGALLAHAAAADLDAVGLVVGVDPRFPDPAAARVVLEGAVAPIAGVDVDSDALEEKAERIREAKQRLAARMRDGDESVTQARTLRMYQ